MAQLGETGPFIVENGAAVCIPQEYFDRQPPGTELINGYWVRAMVEPREHWTALLAGLAEDFPDAFESFSDMGERGIAAVTGLDAEQAALANQRDFSEPVRWLADDAQREQLSSDSLRTARSCTSAAVLSQSAARSIRVRPCAGCATSTALRATL